MDDVVADPNALLKQFDSVSRSQRALFAEFERQRNRLTQLSRWYDHQQSARDSELRREFDQVDTVTRRQINTRSKLVIKERARLKHLLDDDIDHLFTTNNSKPLFQIKNFTDDRKRKVYGCLLPHFKAPLTTNSDQWSPTKSNSFVHQSDFEQHIEIQRLSRNQSLQSPQEQRNRMNMIIEKCVDELEQCDGIGYDHFLQTSKPNLNTQVLPQQNINQKNSK